MNPVTWGVIFTGVITVETLIYVVFTVGLWKQTKAAAEAARISADAARSSVQTLGNLYRPFLGVAGIYIKGQPPSADAWLIVWTLKNFGTLPATNVDAVFDWKVGVAFGGAVAQPNSAEVFPQGEIETPVLCRINPALKEKIVRGDQIFEVNIKIKYSAQSGSSFTHTAYAQWKHETGVFALLKSQTA